MKIKPFKTVLNNLIYVEVAANDQLGHMKENTKNMKIELP